MVYCLRFVYTNFKSDPSLDDEVITAETVDTGYTRKSAWYSTVNIGRTFIIVRFFKGWIHFSDSPSASAIVHSLPISSTFVLIKETKQNKCKQSWLQMCEILFVT